MDNIPGRTIIGVDETGRGSCFGPIVTCAVAFPPGGLPDSLASRIRDSKVMTPGSREEVAAMLRATVSFAFGCASAAEVDAINPLRATMLAMAAAVARLPHYGDPWVIADGPHMPSVRLPGEALIRADASIPEVGATSIIAKVFRDALVVRLARRYPGYGLERHAGYGTKAHFAAVASLGPTRHHRLTFLRRVLPQAAVPA